MSSLKSPEVPPPNYWRRLNLIAAVILIYWAGFWIKSFLYFQYSFPGQTWIPVWNYLSLDYWGAWLATKHWFSGGNPYTETFGDWRGTYAYPPITMVLFIWTAELSQYDATLAWFCLSVAFVTLAALFSTRLRNRITALTFPARFVLALVLISTPMNFAFERGTIDTWCLLLVFLAMLVWTQRNWLADAFIGFLFATCAWIKIYPGALLIGLIPLRRWRAFAFCFLFIILIGVLGGEYTLGFFRNTINAQHDRSADFSDVINWLKHPEFGSGSGEPIPPPVSYGHSITTMWPWIGQSTPFGKVPGLIISGLTIGSLCLIVSIYMWRVAGRVELVWAYCNWLLAAATFVLPYAFDYDLFYLVLAILVVWDLKDHWTAHIAIFYFGLWWQPFAIDISPLPLLLIKLGGLIGCAISLIQKTQLPAVDSALQPIASPAGARVSPA